ncbi:hypothetical protein GCM10010465_19500 [Actinomadura fibrosa]
MFVMHLMGSANGFKIKIVSLPQNFEPLMNKDIMDEKVGHPIDSYAQSYKEKVVVPGLHSEEKSGNSGNGENEKKEVVMLKKPGGLLVVMVFVQNP